MNSANIHYHLNNMVGFPVEDTVVQSTAKTEDGNLVDCFGKVVPVDSQAGFNPGCIFRDIANGVLYLNEGDADLCDFNAVDMA